MIAKKLLTIALLLITPVFMMCSKETTEPKQEAPAIPPQSTFVMDLGDFTSPSLAKTASKGAWLWAVGNVAVWNTVAVVTLAVPVAAFTESFNHNPELQPDGKWLWSYSFTVLGETFTAKLYGALEIDGVQWDMFITQQGSYEDFHWFGGKSDLTLTTGYWTLNYKPTEPTPFLQIDWNRDIDALSGDIKYTNIIPDNGENGSYIYQAFNQPEPYTGLYDIYAKSIDNLISIQWNRDTKVGRISDANHFGDDAWHCWNENFNDVDCP